MKRLGRIVLLTLAGALPAPALAGPACPDYLAGSTMSWATIVCEVRAATDDVGAQAVVDCVTRLQAKDKIRSDPHQNCRLNAVYKAEWCTYYSKAGSVPLVAGCVKSATEIPHQIRDGF